MCVCSGKKSDSKPSSSALRRCRRAASRSRLGRARRRGPSERQALQPVDAVDRAELGLAVERQPGHARGQERERLLELRAREVRAKAVVDARAEGERLGVAAVGVMSNASGSPSTPSRLPVNAQTITTVSAGNVTPRNSTSSCSRRAVNGVIGSKRSSSSTAAGASSGRSRAAPTGRDGRRTGAWRGRAGTASCRRRRPARSARGSCTPRRRAGRPRARRRSASR